MRHVLQNKRLLFSFTLPGIPCPVKAGNFLFAQRSRSLYGKIILPRCSAKHFPLPGRVWDFHPLERAHGAHTAYNTAYKRSNASNCQESIASFFHIFILYQMAGFLPPLSVGILVKTGSAHHQ